MIIHLSDFLGRGSISFVVYQYTKRRYHRAQREALASVPTNGGEFRDRRIDIKRVGKRAGRVNIVERELHRLLRGRRDSRGKDTAQPPRHCEFLASVAISYGHFQTIGRMLNFLFVTHCSYRNCFSMKTVPKSVASVSGSRRR